MKSYYLLCGAPLSNAYSALFNAHKDSFKIFSDHLAPLLEAILEKKPDALIIDNDMQQEMSKQIFSVFLNDEFKTFFDIPVIILQSHVNNEDLAWYKSQNVYSVLAKPFIGSILMETLGLISKKSMSFKNEFLQKSAPSQSSLLQNKQNINDLWLV